MTVMEAFAAGRQEKLSRPKKRRVPLITRAARVVGAYLPKMADIRTFILQVGGLASLDYAAFNFNVIAGYVALGVSMLAFDYFHGED